MSIPRIPTTTLQDKDVLIRHGREGYEFCKRLRQRKEALAAMRSGAVAAKRTNTHRQNPDTNTLNATPLAS